MVHDRDIAEIVRQRTTERKLDLANLNLDRFPTGIRAYVFLFEMKSLKSYYSDRFVTHSISSDQSLSVNDSSTSSKEQQFDYDSGHDFQ